MLLPIKAVAAHFARTPETVRRWVRDGKFPAPVLLPSGREAWPDSVLLDVGTERGSPAADTAPLNRSIP